MTADMSCRCAIAMFLALAIAAGAGLLAWPAFDPLAPWRAALGLLPSGALLALAAALGGRMALRQLGRHAHRAWSSRPAQAALWLTWALGLACWALGALPGQTAPADARLLCWLALLPVWTAAAGLWGRRGAGGAQPVSDGRRGPLQLGPDQGHDLGPVDQVNMGTAGDVLVPRTGEQRVRRREDDVVAMAVDAEEQLAA